MAAVVKSIKRIVTSAGTPVPIFSSAKLVTSFSVRAWKDNTGDVWVGDLTVADPNAAADGADCGMWLEPGESNNKEARASAGGHITQYDLNKIYIDAANDNDFAIIEYEVD